MAGLGCTQQGAEEPLGEVQEMKGDDQEVWC